MFLALFSLLTRMLHLILGVGTPQKFPPPLPPQEEHDCFLRLAQGDEDARQKLILHNLRLVSHIVRKYYPSASSPEDLVSIGTIGLVKAVDSFRVENGAKFATYAGKCIQNEILMHFRAQKKVTAEVSLNETIDVDRDGNPLTYIDVICCEEDIVEEIGRKLLTGRNSRIPWITASRITYKTNMAFTFSSNFKKSEGSSPFDPVLFQILNIIA